MVTINRSWAFETNPRNLNKVFHISLLKICSLGNVRFSGGNKNAVIEGDEVAASFRARGLFHGGISIVVDNLHLRRC